MKQWKFFNCAANECTWPLFLPSLFPRRLTPLLYKRWVNLWWPADFAEDIASKECAFVGGASDLGALVFVGNLVLVVGILLLIFLIHVAVISGVEAFWLLKVGGVVLRAVGWENLVVASNLTCHLSPSGYLGENT